MRVNFSFFGDTDLYYRGLLKPCQDLVRLIEDGARDITIPDVLLLEGTIRVSTSAQHKVDDYTHPALIHYYLRDKNEKRIGRREAMLYRSHTHSSRGVGWLVQEREISLAKEHHGTMNVVVKELAATILHYLTPVRV